MTVRLPRCAAPTAVPETKEAVAATARRRILLVEDQADVRLSLCALIELMGHEVRAAADVARAVELLEDWLPHIAFVDLGLPEIDGFTFAQSLRSNARFSAIRLFALTGYAQPADRARAAAAGFDGFLVKPATPETLAAALADTPQK